MRSYIVSFPGQMGEERDKYARKIARTALNATSDDIDYIEISGYDGQLQQYVDKNSTEHILNEPNVSVKSHLFSDSDIIGTVSGTSENIDAVISLFSVQLPKAIFVAKNGEKIIDRTDYESMGITLSDEDSDLFEDHLSESELQYIEKV